MAFAVMAGGAPAGATKETHPAVRKRYKTVNLAVLYSQTAGGIANRIVSAAHDRKFATTRCGRSLNNRVHAEGDFNFPREWGEGILNQVTWDAVQAKLKGIDKTRRSPRSLGLWLGQFLYCGHCRMRMTGWHQSNQKADPYSYVCSSFRRYGAANTTGCRLHRIHHGEVLPLVEKYLADTEQKLEEVLSAPLATTIVDQAEKVLGDAEREYCRMIIAVWATIKKWEVTNPRPSAGREHTRGCVPVALDEAPGQGAEGTGQDQEEVRRGRGQLSRPRSGCG